VDSIFGTFWSKTEDLQVRLKKEQEDKEHKKKEKAEAHLYTVVKVWIMFFLAVHLIIM
jgi:hypothetical protein